MSSDDSGNSSPRISAPSDNEDSESAREDNVIFVNNDRHARFPLNAMYSMLIRQFTNSTYADDNNSDTDSNGSPGDTSNMEVVDPDEETRVLPCEHQYLGELSQIRGRILMDDGSIQKIPLLFPDSQITLVPGQFIPLMETEENSINILKYTIDKDHVFGIISSTYWNDENALTDVIGTTAEIIAFSESENTFKVKAIGRQRFKIISVASETINAAEITFAKVRILPEINLEPLLDGVRLPSLNKFRSSQRSKCFKRESGLTRWPAWAYQNYDEKYLVKEIKRKLTETFLIQKNVVYSDDPSILSFQVLKNLPISEKLIREAMELNSPIQRLRWFLNVINLQTGKLGCGTCHSTIGYLSDIFAMSAEGAHGTYVNSLGYVHELITLRKVKNIAFSSDMDTNHSWFPGYAWTVLTCKSCSYHLGWKFTAQRENLVPKEFWGIRNSSINVNLQKGADRNLRQRIGQRYRALVTRVH